MVTPGSSTPPSSLAGRLTHPHPQAQKSSPLSPSFPSIAQKHAIAILQHENYEDVLTWLRSPYSSHEYLSSQQALATIALRGCAEADVLAWFQAYTCANELSIGRRDFGSDAAINCQRESRPVPNIAANVHRPNHDDSHRRLNLRSDVYSPHTIFNKYSTSDETSKSTSPYCCTVCGPKHRYKNLSDWKREEKTHEFTYICMYGGVLEYASQSVKSNICGTLDPDEIHSEIHSVGSGMHSTSCGYSCKRRGLMVDHLSKKHCVYNVEEGQTLADKWKSSSGRRVWSCGFCAALFTSFDERLKHIGAEYIDNEYTYEGWNVSNLIKGLLRQPLVATAMDKLLKSHYGPNRPDLFWTADSIGGLQLMLENGPSTTHTAEALAGAAYKGCKFDS